MSDSIANCLAHQKNRERFCILLKSPSGKRKKGKARDTYLRSAQSGLPLEFYVPVSFEKKEYFVKLNGV